MARKRQGQGETLSGSPAGQFTNFAQKPIQSLRSPTTADTGYEIGQLWVNTSTGNIFGLGQVAVGIADWDNLSADFSGDEITAFNESPILQSIATTGVAPTGVSGDINLMCLQEGIIMEQFMIGNQVIIAPRMSNLGLDVALDQIDGKGAEYNFGSDRFANKHIFELGISTPAFIEVKFRIENMSGASPFIIGWRLRALNEQVLTAYENYASIGMDTTTSQTNIVILDKNFPDNQIITDTTDLWGGDFTDNTLRASISTNGSVTYTINGNAPTVTKSFKFEGINLVIPFMRFEQGADLSNVALLSMKVGRES